MAMGLQDRGQQSSLTQQNGAYPLFFSLLAACTLALAQLFSFLEDPHFVSCPIPPCGENHADFKACGVFPPCQWVIVFLGLDGPTGEGRSAAETSHSEDHTQDPTLPNCPYNEHTASVRHTEHFPPSLAQPQASPQLQLTVSLARPH